ncbi:MAG: hypothetical protein LC657_14190, partial [Desulfobacteraceae bacterium]|nr:hypothetical protein [Desulfobacteraceae bacterium]
AGTAGTTVRGAYDPIAPLLALRDQYGFWLHMDGAWGGAVVLSDRLRQQFLPGIEQVDSFCWDFHKMPGTALICNVFLVNNRPHTLGRVCSSGDDSYIFHTTPFDSKRRSRLRQTISLRKPFGCLQSHSLQTS